MALFRALAIIDLFYPHVFFCVLQHGTSPDAPPTDSSIEEGCPRDEPPADGGEQSTEDRWFEAVKQQQCDVVRQMLDCGTDVNIIDEVVL